MFLRICCVATFLLSIVITTGEQVRPVIAQPADDGIEVQTRGPIHEAFAQPADQQPTASPVITKKPPEPINEIPPDQKPEGDDVIWISGYWAFDEDRDDFVWISGIWRTAPPDRQWIPGYWQEEQGGHRWIAGYWALENQTSIELLPPPPQPVEEVGPPQPNANMVYVPGVWVYRVDRYWWQPGHWIPARAGWIWIPPHYCWTPGGYIFVPGYWDFELDRRGLCFAPVWIDRRVYARSGWAYRPRYVVRADFVLGSLFVNVRFNRYYFGDYYDPLYTRRGYTSWVNYRVRGNVLDPMFYYYRWANRADDRWETNLRTTYQMRQQNQDARPPRTLAQQQRTTDQKFQIAAPLDQVKVTGVKLQTVSKTQIEEIRKTTERLRTISTERRKVETATKATPSTKGAPKTPVKVDLPKPAVKPPATRQKAPPLPDAPKVQKEPDVPKVKPKLDVPKKVTPEPLPKPDVPKILPKPPVKEPDPPKVLPKPPTKEPEPPKVLPKPPTKEPEPPKVLPKPPTKEPEPPKVLPKPPTKEPEPPKVLPKPPTKEPEPPKKEKDKDKKAKDKKDGAAVLAPSSSWLWSEPRLSAEAKLPRLAISASPSEKHQSPRVLVLQRIAA